MSFVKRKVAHCDICGHEWIPDGSPTHCASSKCKSRRWNSSAPAGSKHPAPIKQHPQAVTLVDKIQPLPSSHSDHDPKNCRVYRCGMCAIAKK